MHLLLGLILLVPVGSGWGSGAGPGQGRASAPGFHGEEEEHLERGLEALEAGDLEEAIVQLEAARPHGGAEEPGLRFRRAAALARICHGMRERGATTRWIEEAVEAARESFARDREGLARALRELEALRPPPLPQEAAAKQEAEAAVPRLGSGRHVYEWVRGWGRLPEGMRYGNTHGAIAFDKAGRVYVNTDSENAILVFEKDGSFVRGYGAPFKGGLHGMLIREEEGREVLYLAHHGRHQAYKTTLDGEVLRTFDWPEAAGTYASRDQFRPTSVAVAPDGTVFVADGYGLSYVHRYAADGKWLGAFGGAGAAPGKFQTPHGLLLDTRVDPPALLVADRENHRIQAFSLDGKLLRVIEAELRRPCMMHRNGTDIVVADLAGRVTILDQEDHVVAHLGDQPDPAKRAQNGVPPSEWKDGEFISPHSAAFDADGNLYVMDWLASGRVTKLARVR